MINIFSYKEGSRFTGKQINDFLGDQRMNGGSHVKEAYRVAMEYILKDDRLYEISYLPIGPGQDPCRDTNKRIGFIRVKGE